MVAQIREAAMQMGQVGRSKIHLEKLEVCVQSVAEKVSGEGQRKIRSVWDVLLLCTHPNGTKWKHLACSSMDSTRGLSGRASRGVISRQGEEAVGGRAKRSLLKKTQ